MYVCIRLRAARRQGAVRRGGPESAAAAATRPAIDSARSTAAGAGVRPRETAVGERGAGGGDRRKRYSRRPSAAGHDGSPARFLLQTFSVRFEQRTPADDCAAADEHSTRIPVAASSTAKKFEKNRYRNA